MKSTLLYVSLVALAACGGGKAKTEKPGGMMDKGGMMDMKMGMADPAAGTAPALAAAKGYATWAKFAENQEPKKSEGHMGMFVLAFHNKVVGDAITAKTLPLPDGAVIVKEEMMSADAKPMSVTIMSKQAGAWYYVKASPDLMKVMTMNGMALEGTSVSMCKDCHDQGSDNDFVMTHKFK
jgi:hypothetical protein